MSRVARDSYYYLEDYKCDETVLFEGLSVPGPDGVKYYNKLTYDVEGLFGSLLRKYVSGRKESCILHRIR